MFVETYHRREAKVELIVQAEVHNKAKGETLLPLRYDRMKSIELGGIRELISILQLISAGVKPYQKTVGKLAFIVVGIIFLGPTLFLRIRIES